MNIRRPVTVTVDGKRHTLQLSKCQRCPGGTVVRRGSGMLGHITLGRFNGPATVTAAVCPGDVRITSAYGIVRRGPSRMGVLVESVRSVVRFLG